MKNHKKLSTLKSEKPFIIVKDKIIFSKKGKLLAIVSQNLK